MAAPPYIPSFYFNTFAQGISEPYTALSAYQSGSIDENGNFLKPESSIDPLEYLIIKLKRIFAELPMGMTKAKLGNYMSTMQLFGEEAKEFGITDSEFMGLVEANLALNGHTEVSYIELCEDMASGGMATAGTSPSYNTGSVSGYDPAMGTVRRKQPVLTGMDNCEMFDVCPEEMGAFKAAKAWKHVPESDTKRYLQRYQRRNPKGHMALRSMNPDTGESDIYWIKFKPLSFMEEFGLENKNLEILLEDVNLGIINLLVETKKNSRPRNHDDNHEQFKSHVLSLLELHKNEKSAARKSEYEARVINHIKNYHLVKSNPAHLKSYIDTTHQTILNSASANSSDTHSVHFDDKGNMSLKAIDVKDIGRGDAYVSVEIPKTELTSISGLRGLIDTSTESNETRIKRQPGISAKIKETIEAYYKTNPTKAVEKPSQGSFMVKRSDGRFYMSGPEILSPTSEKKVRVSPTGHQRRARKENKEIPHPELRRITARRAIRVLDPKKQKPDLTPVSIKSDEYASTRSLFGDEGVSLDALLKPHFE